MARREETDGAADPTRREFFRTFGRQSVRQAGAVMGAAAELRRAGGAAARELLEVGSQGPVVSQAGGSVSVDRGRTEDERAAGAPPAPSFRSAYRLGEDTLLILDQRDLPNRTTVLTCSEPTEVASAIRSGAINSGPVLGEVAAYTLAAVLARSAAGPVESRDELFRAAANTLRGARREVHALRAAVDRMEGRYDALTDGGGSNPGRPSELAQALRTEADAIASEAQLAHAALGRSGAGLISAAAAANPARTAGEPISLLMHGDSGPLSCGLVGAGTHILQALAGLDHSLHVWLTEAAPGMEGARISALQLTQLDIPHTVIADTAVGWLLSSRRLDGVLLRADTVATNADTVTVIGGLGVARLAKDAGVAVYVLAPSSAFNGDASDGKEVTLDLRSPAEALAGSVDRDGQSRPAVFGVRLNPTSDVVPAQLVTAFLTETGPRALGRA